MPIVQKTPSAEIQSYVIRRIERIQQAIIYNLLAIGEKVVTAARVTAQKGRDFKDQTGNLRSSIGYVISVDGQIVKSSTFDAVKEGSEGSREGKAFAEQLARQYQQGIVLLVVAGKEYAKYVAARGFDVLDTAELLAQQLVPQMLKQLGM